MAGIDLSFGSTKFPRAREVRQKLYENGSAGQTTRYRRLDRLDAFYKCLEYEHQDTGWDGYPADRFETISPQVVVPTGFTQPAADQKPVNQRRPSAPLRLCPLVVDRFTGLLFSKERTPKLAVEGDPDAEDFLQAVFKKARFWRTMYQARTFGGSQGASMVTIQLRKGRFSYTAHPAKIVSDVLWEDADLRIPAGVLIQYIFMREQEVLDDKGGFPTGQTKLVPYLFRRIIDEEWDVKFKPGRIEGRELPKLEVDMHESYEHGLGRFPGVWIQNLPSDEELDGIPDCDGAFQMFDAIDRQVSQSNKGLLYNQDPTLVYGRDKRYEAIGIPLKKGSENALNIGMGGTATYLEMSGAGIAAAGAFVKDLRQAAMDKCQAVLVDPTQISGAAQSAKAIEYIYGPMLEKAGRLREQYGEAVELLGDLTLDIARRWFDPLQYEGNVQRVMFDLPPKLVELDQDVDNPNPELGQQTRLEPRHPGKGGIVSLTWGAYFQETPTDVQMIIGTLATAYQAQAIDQETFVRKVAHVLEIEDVDGLLRKVREEAEQKKQEMMQAGMGMFDGGMGGGQTDEFGQPVEPQVDEFGQPVAPEMGQPGMVQPGMGEPSAAQILNGAQIQAAQEIIEKVAAGALSPSAAISMLVNFLGVEQNIAEQMVNDAAGAAAEQLVPAG